MTVAVPTPFPVPGDPGYVDHGAIALSRLPQQFRQERLDPPIQPVFVTSAPAGVTVDPATNVFVYNVPVLPEISEGDCLLLIIASDSTDSGPDPTLIPDGWSVLTQVRSPNTVFSVTLMRHIVGRDDTQQTSIFALGDGFAIQAGVVVYRYVDASDPLISASAADAGTFPITSPTLFHHPSQFMPSTSDLYLGIAWGVDANLTIEYPAQTRHNEISTSISTSISTLAIFDRAGFTGTSGVQDLTVLGGVGGVAVSLALRFSLSDFDRLNNIGRLVASCCIPVQSLWDVMQQVLLQRTIDTAVGVQLDVVGKIVGRNRDGLDDDTFRRYCRATVAAHRSRGTVDELIKIAELVLFDPLLLTTISQYSPATVVVQLVDTGITDTLAHVVFVFLRQAAAAGVAIVLQYGNTTPVFHLDQSPGLDQGLLAGEISG